MNLGYSSANASPGFGANGAGEAVSILVAGQSLRVQNWMAALMADGRFRVSSAALDAADLRLKLASTPEVLFLDCSILEGEAQLTELLTRLQGCSAYLITPPEAGPELPTRLKAIPSVKGAFFADANLSELAGRMYAEALALRRAQGSGSVWNGASSTGGLGPTGLRVIAVWNQMGGVGKTTIATNLAYEAARRGFPTLLIGLGAPDDLPLILGLRPEPNITAWWTNPTTEGIRLATQKLDTLDVIGGFPDVLSESQAVSIPAEAPNSIPRLIHTAAHYAGYAVIVVDAPPTSLAASAISACNTLILVARPSLEGVMRTAEAYKTVVERLGGEHRIPSENIHVVLNRAGNRLTADEWHRAASQLLGRSFPPVIAQIPDVSGVGAAQDSRRLPLLTSDDFRSGVRPLFETLLRSSRPSGQTGALDPRKVINLGLVKIKV